MNWGGFLWTVIGLAGAFSAGFGYRGMIQAREWEEGIREWEISRAKMRHPGYQNWGRGEWDG